MESSAMNGILVIGAPSWGQNHPFYSVAVVAQVARNCGWKAVPLDLNVEFYNTVTAEERSYWDFARLGSWLDPKFVDELYAKYEHVLLHRLKTAVRAEKYSLIGFSVNDWTCGFTLRLCDVVRRICPGTPILFGGVSCYPGEKGTSLLTGPHGRPDLILQGEAEAALPKFLAEFAETRSIATQIPGFAYLRDGLIVDLGVSELPKLRKLPLITEFSGFDIEAYPGKGDFPSHFSRGCIYKCHFCSEFSNQRLYRFRRADVVFEEIKRNVSVFRTLKNVPHVYFADSLINGKLSELERFCDLVIESGLKFTWGGQAHFRDELTMEFLSKMHRAGCREFLWGFESGSQRVVDLMNKGYDLGVAERVLKDCAELGMTSAMPVMIGYPGEAADDVIDTMNFIFRNWRYCNFFTPGPMIILPNSPIGKDPAKYGIRDADANMWVNSEGDNNHQVRLFRRFLVYNAVRGTRYSAFEWLESLDLTVPAVLRETILFLGAIERRFPEALTRDALVGAVRNALVRSAMKPEEAAAVNSREFKQALARCILDVFLQGAGGNARRAEFDGDSGRSEIHAVGFVDEIAGRGLDVSRGMIDVEAPEIFVLGWAALPAPLGEADGVVITVGGSAYTGRYGLPRPDVARAISPHLFHVGFSCAIPTAEIVGSAEIVVEAVDRKSDMRYRLSMEKTCLRRAAAGGASLPS